MQYNLSDKIDELREILINSIGNKVRYRAENVLEFTNDKLIGYEENEDDITITLENATVITLGVNKVGFTEYDERIDIWLYGKEFTNRFNVFK